MFDIPMKTTGAMDSSSLLALNGSGAMAQPQQMPQQQMPMPQQQYNQQMPQQQPMPQQQMPQQQYNQQPIPQQQYNQQPMPQQRQYSSQQMPQQQMPQQQAMPQQPMAQQPMPQQRPSGNGVHLKKGQKFALAGQNGVQLTNIEIGLGWDLVNQACDLDASAFMLGADNRVIGDDWFVFYGQTSSPDGSVVHSGDSDGSAVGDDETIRINLNQVNQQVQKITFVVTINEALEKGLNFSMVQNAYVRVVDKSTNNELARFMLTDYYATVTSMVVGELYRHNGSWKFNAVGDGVAKDLYGLCTMYGVNIAD